MKIEGPSKIQSVYGANSVSTVQPKSKVQMAKDILSVSTVAKDYSVAAKALKNVPDVREDLVDKLKQQIESGNYNTSGNEIISSVQNAMFDTKI